MDDSYSIYHITLVVQVAILGDIPHEAEPVFEVLFVVGFIFLKIAAHGIGYNSSFSADGRYLGSIFFAILRNKTKFRWNGPQGLKVIVVYTGGLPSSEEKL